MTDLTAWYLPTCPPWCDRTHGGILTPEDDPATFDSPETQPYVCHAHTLTASGAGLTVSLAQWEAHATADLTEHTAPSVYVYLPEHHDTTGTTPATLRAWARLLDAAATEAEALTEGTRR